MTPDRRLHFLDHLRLFALGLLLLYHVGMAYVPWPWHVKGSATSAALAPGMLLLNPWRMSLLFVVSGAVTGLLLPGAAPGWLRARLKRLGWPLLAGVLLIVPPQAWWQVREQFGYGGSFSAFMGLYLRGYGGFCDAAGACLVLPTWNHLWFLPYLMLYTVGLWALLRRWPDALDRAGAWLAPRLGALSLLGLPWLLLAVLRLALRPWFEVTHDLIHDPLAHAQYLPAFLAGALLARTPGAWAAVERLRWTALVLALLGWGAAQAWGESMPLVLARAGFALEQWCGVLAALGFGHRWLGAPTVHTRTASRLVFPVYVLHQTVLIGLLVALKPLGLAPGLEAALVLAGTLGLSLLGAAAAGRVRWLAPWLGG
jgi:glucans biosynthesis protein C